jgi:hypothetical protein
MLDAVWLSGWEPKFTARKGGESAHKFTDVCQRCAKNAEGEQPNVFLNMCENADWLV